LNHRVITNGSPIQNLQLLSVKKNIEAEVFELENRSYDGNNTAIQVNKVVIEFTPLTAKNSKEDKILKDHLTTSILSCSRRSLLEDRSIFLSCVSHFLFLSFYFVVVISLFCNKLLKLLKILSKFLFKISQR